MNRMSFTRFFLCLLGVISLNCRSGNCDEWTEAFDSLATAKVEITQFGGTNNVFVTNYASAFGVPEAPRMIPGSQPSEGLIVEVNRSSPGTVSAVNASALLAPGGGAALQVSGEYHVAFDVYMSLSVSSLPYTGSTEAMLWGVGTNDAHANGRGATTANDGVWGWLAVDGGFLTEDATLYRGDTPLKLLHQQPPGASPFFARLSEAFHQTMCLGIAGCR